MSNIVSSHFPPRQGTYQHTFQNQQNINIEINLTSPSQLLGTGTNTEKRKRNYEQRVTTTEREREKEKEKDKDVDDFYDEFKDFPYYKEPETIKLPSFDPSSIKIEDNPFDNFELLSCLNKEQCDLIPSALNEVTEKKEEKIVDIKSSYLLAKIQNWRLVTNFVSADELKEEKFENILKEDEMDIDDKEKKFYLVYDKNIERDVDKIIEGNNMQKNKIKNEIMNVMNGIEHCTGEVRKIQNKLFVDEWKLNLLDIKLEAINVKDSTKDY